MKRALSLAALTVLELSPPEMVSCAADAGYSHVGLRLLAATDNEPTWPLIGDTPMVREIEHRLADRGVQTLDIEIFRLRPDTVVMDYLSALETGARLGARHVLVAGNDPDEARLTERFAAFCALGAPLGLTMDLEPMPWTDVKTLQQAARDRRRSGRGECGGSRSIRFISTAAATCPPILPRCRRRGCITRNCAMRRQNVRRMYPPCCIRPAPSDSCPATADSIWSASCARCRRRCRWRSKFRMQTLARTVPAVERAKRIRARTEDLLAKLGSPAVTR